MNLDTILKDAEQKSNADWLEKIKWAIETFSDDVTGYEHLVRYHENRHSFEQQLLIASFSGCCGASFPDSRTFIFQGMVR